MSWSIERYLNVRQAYAPTFAPDGNSMLTGLSVPELEALVAGLPPRT
jgi:hypothetical protein